ncbi:MAG TPA: hypothetical protein VKZ85_08855 [Woeseiaceae bacterium]|nr:hypothetical protein [Woeseiaceae bacterium]
MGECTGEPGKLVEARRHLGAAESGYRSPEGLAHLEAGLALLEEVALDAADEHRTVAANLLAAYSSRICQAVRGRVESDPALPEPELEHLFRLLLAFDAVPLELPGYVRSLKVDIARRLVERYYEGYPAEEKARALEQLAGIAEG